jgi:hypothetical protein
MEFGGRFTSHPNHASEPYPHRDRDMRASISRMSSGARRTAWVAWRWLTLTAG